MSDMAEYKLTYFPVRAKAESVRIALSFAGVNFEDIRVNQKQWQPIKASKFNGYENLLWRRVLRDFATRPVKLFLCLLFIRQSCFGRLNYLEHLSVGL